MQRRTDGITAEIISAAIEIHRALGPGLLESVCESILERDLRRRGLFVERGVAVQFEYDGMVFKDGLRVDLLVNREVVVELKSVERLAPVHSRQLLTYIRLLGLEVGLLINFGGATLKEGLHRILNDRPPPCLRASV